MKIKPFALVEAIVALIGLLFLLPDVFGQQFWDGPHLDNNTIEGGTGTWNNSNPNWANINGIGGNVYSSTSDVIFSGAAGIVTLGSPIQIINSSIRFSTDSYVVNPNGFVLNVDTRTAPSTPITVDAGLQATINAPITGSSNGSSALSKSGAGTLILSGVNTYSDGTQINAGVLSISQDANLGTPPPGPSPRPRLIQTQAELSSTAGPCRRQPVLA